MKYTEPRFTKDLDVWISNSPENARRAFLALVKFGAPLEHDGVTPGTFAQEGLVYQIGVEPVRIDILAHITGVQFADAWRDRVESTIFGIPVHFLSLSDLVANKKAAGRPSDLDHLEWIHKQGGGKP